MPHEQVGRWGGVSCSLARRRIHHYRADDRRCMLPDTPVHGDSPVPPGQVKAFTFSQNPKSRLKTTIPCLVAVTSSLASFTLPARPVVGRLEANVQRTASCCPMFFHSLGTKKCRRACVADITTVDNFPGPSDADVEDEVVYLDETGDRELVEPADHDMIGTAMAASETDCSSVLHIQRSASRKTSVEGPAMPSTARTAGAMAFRLGSGVEHTVYEEAQGRVARPTRRKGMRTQVRIARCALPQILVRQGKSPPLPLSQGPFSYWPALTPATGWGPFVGLCQGRFCIGWQGDEASAASAGRGHPIQKSRPGALDGLFPGLRAIPGRDSRYAYRAD